VLKAPRTPAGGAPPGGPLSGDDGPPGGGRDGPPPGGQDGTAGAAAEVRRDRRLIALLLLAAAALDLTRCGVVMVTAAHAVPAAGLVAAGLAAAAVSLRTARGCRAGRRWSGWAALLIGAMSAPQAAVSGFHPPYAIPDTATAAVGILLTVTVLATAGRPGQPRARTGDTCVIGPRDGEQDDATR
jgi:hypothetical protein